MSLAELKAEVDRLTPEDRFQLRSYLALKDQISDPDFFAGLSEKLKDHSPDRWLTLDQFETQVDS